MTNPEPTAPVPAPVYMQPTYLVVAPPPRGMSVASMVLGLVSIVFGFTFVCPVVGLILGIIGIKREPAGRGMAIAGIIINAVILAGWAIAVIFIIFVFPALITASMISH